MFANEQDYFYVVLNKDLDHQIKLFLLISIILKKKFLTTIEMEIKINPKN